MARIANAAPLPEIKARIEAIINYLRLVAGPEDELLRRLLWRYEQFSLQQPDYQVTGVHPPLHHDATAREGNPCAN